jgi:hypothetical protein
LIDCAISLIAKDSVIYHMIGDIREWHAAEPDWHKTRGRIAGLYNYENYGGNCHMVPNHALIILGLLYGHDSFQEAMKVVNTAGWDTDCNSGNLGCLLGIKNGLAGLDAGPDWRGPVADRLFLAAADGGRSITDALIETYHVVNAGRALQQEASIAPKNGARFHFDLPGSLQGFRAESESVTLANVPGHSQEGQRALAIQFDGPGRASTPTFILPSELDMPGYSLVASPTIYPGQLLRAELSAAEHTQVHLFVRAYNEKDELIQIDGPQFNLEPGEFVSETWIVPPTGGQPVAEVGLAYAGQEPATVYLDTLGWEGAPDITLTRPGGGEHPWDPPLVWRRAWVDGLDLWEPWWQESYRLIQNSGRGLITQGTREWADYEVAATVIPVLMSKGGIGVRAQGMRRYYALLLCDDNKVRLIKALDGDQILAEADFEWQVNQSYGLRLQGEGSLIRAWVDDKLLFTVRDEERPLTGGAAAFIVEEGHMMSEAMRVRPIR